MRLEDCIRGMRIRYSVDDVTYIGEIVVVASKGIEVRWDNGVLEWYRNSIPFFEPVNPQPVIKQEKKDSGDEIRFFGQVSPGQCPCGIVRSQCQYHISIQ